MNRVAPACFVRSFVCNRMRGGSVTGAGTSPIGGVWTINRALGEFPKEIGFNIDLGPVSDTPAGASGGSSGGARGRRGSGGGGSRSSAGTPFALRRESYDEAQRLRLLTAEARNPPSRLTIVDGASAVIITNELGQARTLHPNGREETIEIEGAQVPATARRDGDKLVVTYPSSRTATLLTRIQHPTPRSGLRSRCSF